MTTPAEHPQTVEGRPTTATFISRRTVAAALTDIEWWKHADPDSDNDWSSGELADALIDRLQKKQGDR